LHVAILFIIAGFAGLASRRWVLNHGPNAIHHTTTIAPATTSADPAAGQLFLIGGVIAGAAVLVWAIVMAFVLCRRMRKKPGYEEQVDEDVEAGTKAGTKAEEQAAVKIQASMRGNTARKDMLEQEKAATTIQASMRGTAARKETATMEPGYVVLNVKRGTDGFGLHFALREGFVTVASLDEDSEGKKAGVLVGDKLVKLQDNSGIHPKAHATYKPGELIELTTENYKQALEVAKEIDDVKFTFKHRTRESLAQE